MIFVPGYDSIDFNALQSSTIVRAYDKIEHLISGDYRSSKRTKLIMIKPNVKNVKTWLAFEKH